MFDTQLVVVGNVLTAPEWRRTANTNSLVANFKVASTARRLDRESGNWVDGNSLRVRVTCWRKLAEGVASSVMVGDPVIVYGRLYTRDWTDSEGNARTAYEMEAAAIGHDLARGRGQFMRNRPTLATSAVDDALADSAVPGATTESAPDDPTPGRTSEGSFDDEPELGDVPPTSPAGFDPLATIRGGGFDDESEPAPVQQVAPSAASTGMADDGADLDLDDGGDLPAGGSGHTRRAGRGRARATAPA